VSAAQQIAYADLDRDFFSLPLAVQNRIQRKLDEMGLRLRAYPKQKEVADGNGISFYALQEGVVTIEGQTLERWVYCQPPPQKKK